MPNVVFDYRKLISGGDVPASLFLTLTPSRDLTGTETGHPRFIASPLDTLDLSAGPVTKTLRSTDGTWCWVLQQVSAAGRPVGIPTGFFVPASGGPYDLQDLTFVDPSTMVATSVPAASWWLQAVPAGGTTGQVLIKTANGDYQVGWSTVAGGSSVPAGGTTGQALVKTSNVDGAVGWGDVSVTAATLTASGVVELATTTETTTGTDAVRATTPAGVKAALDARASSYIAAGSLAAIASSGSASDLGTGTVPIARIPTGTTGSTVALGNHTQAASTISDATTVGKAVLTATDATTARTAISAGTSDLTLGTTAGTAADGSTAAVEVEWTGIAWPARPTISRSITWVSTKDVAATAPTAQVTGDRWIKHPDAA